ncbi:hypothetical protein GX563_09385 [Candidatus Bathyarchaeota archaeon]|nr:hypothetical protein [Candidatus Bathyarchaeota archaeon]
MPSAIVLLSTASGTEKSVLNHLRAHEGIQEAYMVQSAFDIIVTVKAETFEKLTSIISKIKLYALNPLSIVTMLIVEGSVTG